MNSLIVSIACLVAGEMVESTPSNMRLFMARSLTGYAVLVKTPPVYDLGKSIRSRICIVYMLLGWTASTSQAMGRAVAKSSSFRPPEQRELYQSDKRMRVWHERYWFPLVEQAVPGRCC